MSTSLAAFVHAALAGILSFIVLLFALYVVAGGILVTGNLRGTTATNVALLAFGTFIASIVGTTGAAMILIRPLLRANEDRRANAHVVVFFIFLVCNIGGALSPLGDPPLFIGFLKGVDFFWTTIHLWRETVLVTVAVLIIFTVMDIVIARRDGLPDAPERAFEPARPRPVNLALIALIIAAILGSALWKPGIVFNVLGTDVELQNLVRDAVLLLIAALSLWLTPEEHRAANGFTFEPIREVAILFAGIFTCIIPVLAKLEAGRRRHVRLADQCRQRSERRRRDDAMYFWLTGILSGFLDNAPTYLVFFNLAGGDRRTTDDPTCDHADGDLHGRRLHGRADLHRQRAELHGLCDRLRTRRRRCRVSSVSSSGRCWC